MRTHGTPKNETPWRGNTHLPPSSKCRVRNENLLLYEINLLPKTLYQIFSRFSFLNLLLKVDRLTTQKCKSLFAFFQRRLMGLPEATWIFPLFNCSSKTSSFPLLFISTLILTPHLCFSSTLLLHCVNSPTYSASQCQIFLQLSNFLKQNPQSECQTSKSLSHHCFPFTFLFLSHYFSDVFPSNSFPP